MKLIKLFVFWILVHEIDGLVLASSTLEQCIDAGDDGIECDQKVVVSLTVENEQGPVESISANIDSMIDENGDEVQLTEPMVITLSKSTVKYRHPIAYKQHFYNNPYEEVIYVSQDFMGLSGGCEDGYSSDGSNYVTCGWQHQDNGVVIDHSQGFCCQCDGFSNVDTRAGDCSSFTVNDHSAHCLRFDELQYGGYEVTSGPETLFDIDVYVSWMDQNGNYQNNTLTISPQVPGVTTPDGKIVARLVGDFAPYVAAPDYTDRMLFKPEIPVTHPRVGAGIFEWMLIRRDEVTFDGRDCNKIGVSYEAFRAQGNACQMSPGSCLGGQLEDFYDAGAHFLPSFGTVDLSDDDDGVFLRFTTDDFSTSLVTLTLDATDVSYILNVADGEIVSCVANDFEALSTNGTLNCNIQNTGSIVSQFTISVTDCDGGIQEIHFKRATINPGETKTVSFNIQSSQASGYEHTCSVTLQNSLEEVVDQTAVSFSTTETQVDTGAQGGNVGEDPDVVETVLNEDPCEECGMFDVICMFWSKCWKDIFTVIIILCVIVFGVPMLIKLACRHASVCDFDGPKRKKKKKKKRRYESSSESSSSPVREKKRKKKKKKSKKKKKRNKRKDSYDFESESEGLHEGEIELEITNTAGSKKKKKKRKIRV